ncbi:hypothetical protein CLIB1444_19S00562 [[Candida] jaroonii]|uniref:Uncharacterized protein n=1 Tax=[Candida] jaroonii TaxID=467808 RepID=A0ACA9YFP0_9ASCO|nr:hypothetical protein CLIB1444_19S00562 [[Candida] jaroonii]
MTIEDFSGIGTEQRNPKTSHIDSLSTDRLLKLMNEEDTGVIEQVSKVIPIICDVVDDLAPKIKAGGRLFYLGAGTSGRLGVLDASEILPTYSAPEGQFVGLIAGGDVALRKAQEFSEDSETAAAEDLAPFNVTQLDTIIGIASSGRTPYVMGALKYGQSIGVKTIGLACVSNSPMEKHSDFMISCVTGPEIVTGSTRMKAGTATKLILNMISTSVMIKIGKTYGNLMVDLQPSNIKLQDRTRRIFKAVVPGQLSDDDIDNLIKKCGSLKTAIVVGKTGIDIEEAKTLIDKNGGNLRQALDSIEDNVSEASSSANGSVASDISSPPAKIPDFSDYNLAVDIVNDECEVALFNKSVSYCKKGAFKGDFKNLLVQLLVDAVTSYDGQVLKINGVRIGSNNDFDLKEEDLKGLVDYKSLEYVKGTPKFCDMIRFFQ